MSKNELVTMKSDNDVFCSMACKTQEEKVQLFNAINNADASLDDMVGKQICVVNVYAERYTAEDEEENKDGFEPVEKEKIMITLICKNGKIIDFWFGWTRNSFYCVDCVVTFRRPENT